jgi:hypothetical protein
MASYKEWLKVPDSYYDPPEGDDIVYCELCESDEITALVDDEFYSCQCCVEKIVATIKLDNPTLEVKVKIL